MKQRSIIVVLCSLLVAIFTIAPSAGAQASGSRAALAGTVSAPLRPDSPPPYCPDNFEMFRKDGTIVNITAIGLYTMYNGDMLVWPSDQNGTSYSAHSASPRGGANFEIDTGSTTPQNITVDLTDAENTRTICYAVKYI